MKWSLLMCTFICFNVVRRSKFVCIQKFDFFANWSWNRSNQEMMAIHFKNGWLSMGWRTNSLHGKMVGSHRFHPSKSACLVGGFNPIEKYSSNWIISTGKGEKKTYLKPPPSCLEFQEDLISQESSCVIFTSHLPRKSHHMSSCPNR